MSTRLLNPNQNDLRIGSRFILEGFSHKYLTFRTGQKRVDMSYFSVLNSNKSNKNAYELYFIHNCMYGSEILMFFQKIYVCTAPYLGHCKNVDSRTEKVITIGLRIFNAGPKWIGKVDNLQPILNFDHIYSTNILITFNMRKFDCTWS